MDLLATESRSDSCTLSVARELGAYILAANWIEYYSEESFVDFVQSVITKTRYLVDELVVFRLVDMIETDPSNWGTYARATLLIAALYLDDLDLVERIATAFENWLGRDGSSF